MIRRPATQIRLTAEDLASVGDKPAERAVLMERADRERILERLADDKEIVREFVRGDRN